jgi:hypothetical protein
MMATPCSICIHEKKLDIDRAIVRGGSIASVARNFCVSPQALWHHSKNHISKNLVKAMEKQDMANSLDLMTTIDTMLKRSEAILERNFRDGNDVTALKALDSKRNIIDLLAKISYQLHQAKLAEVELARLQAEPDESETIEKQTKELRVFNTTELEMYFKLLNKLVTQDHSIEVIPLEESPFPKFTRTKGNKVRDN